MLGYGMRLSQLMLDDLPLLHNGAHCLVLAGTSAHGQPAAIKLLKSEAITPEALSRLANEYALGKDLGGPGLRCALESIQIEGRPALVLEYIDGQTLRQAYVASRRPLLDVLTVAASAANALHRLHHLGMVHRNLSSDNILVDAAGQQATLIDFGLAARVDPSIGHLGVPDAPVGSLATMAPEQSGWIDRPVDGRADLYSLGVVIYEMLVGKPPFAAEGTTELIHCHLAKTPTPPQTIDAAIPQVLSDIVMSLLRKDPDERYRSAYGVWADLERCRDAMATSGAVASFPLGQDDSSGLFRIPLTLYGRDREFQTALRAFERVGLGSGEFLMISGPGGVGKTALAERVCKAVAERGGRCIEGHCDAYQMHTPYYGLMRALAELVEQMLAESAGWLGRTRAAIMRAVGANAALLVEAIPTLELIIGTPAPVQDPGTKESQSRFQHALLGLLRCVASEGRGLVLYLDNLQWADAATLEFLAALGTEIGRLRMLVVGAFRDDEVGAGHLLETLFADLKRRGAPLARLRLESLPAAALAGLVADTLGGDADHAQPLAELIHKKSGGNPFAAVQFFQSLHQNGHLVFDDAARRWVWDEEAIRGMDVADNIARLMADRVEGLPEATRGLLSLAACLGAAFDLESLAELAGQGPQQVVDSLGPALADGLLRPGALRRRSSGPCHGPPVDATVRFEFPHDRVRRACYTSLPIKRRRAMHLDIGRLRLRGTPEAELESRIYDIVDQLNEGFQYVVEEQEKLRLAELNLIAGRRAKREAAYMAAIRYLSMGIGLLPSDRWESHYDLSMQLYMEAVEAEYLSSNFDRAELLSTEVLRHAREILPRIAIHELRVLFLAAQQRHATAIRAGLEALEFLDVHIPTTAEQREKQVEGLRRDLAAAIDRVEDVTHLPPMTDPKRLAALRIMTHLAAPAHQTDSALLEDLVLTMVLTSVRHGNSALAAVAYGWYAALLCGTYGDVEGGYRIGQVSLAVHRQHRSMGLEAKITVLFNVFVRHWKEHAGGTIADLEWAAQRGMEAGDMDYATLACVHACEHLFFSGAPLERVRDQAAECLAMAERFNLTFPDSLGRIWAQTIQNLMVDAADPSRLIGSFMDEASALPVWMEYNENILAFQTLGNRTMLQYLFGDHLGAIESARLAEVYASAGAGSLSSVQNLFYAALAHLARCQDADVDSEARRGYLERAAACQKRLSGWAEHAPMNVRHKCDLIEAELARNAGDTSRAMLSFGRALHGARENGYIQEEALAYEREADFHQATGRDDLASACVRKAADLYRLWGATCKSKALERRHQGLLRREGCLALDTAAILEATQTISQELRLEQLLERMVQTLMQHAGAEKGVLIENKDGNLLVQAVGAVDRERVETMRGTPVEQCTEVPLTAVNYVMRTRTPLVLHDAAGNSAFAGDAYIFRHKTKSLLCLPILHQARLSGIMYLENNKATHVFTASRLELLKALSSQAAISIQNAVLYADLETSVQELERAREALATRMGYEKGLSACSQTLLLDGHGHGSLSQALAHLLVAADVSRAYLFENFEDAADGLCMRQTQEACAPGVTPQIDNPLLQHVPYSMGFERWKDILSANKPVVGLVEELPLQEQDILKAQEILSIMVLPIWVKGSWYGFIGLDDTRNRRQWNEQGLQLLEAASSLIGNYIERKQAAEALQKSQARYQGLFEDSPHSLWEEDFSAVRAFLDDLRASGVSDVRAYFDANPEAVANCAALVKVLDVNASTVDLFKAPSKEAFLAGLSRIFTPQAFDIFREELIGLASGTLHFQAEAEQRTFDGDVLYVVLRLSVAPGSECSLERVLVSLEDITQRKRAEKALEELNKTLEKLVDERTTELQLRSQELEAAYIRLQEMDALKSTLMDTVSHDLRTPLTSILGFAKIILRDFTRFFHEPTRSKDDLALRRATRIQDNLSIIVTEGERLTRLINDFLDLSKIESGRLQWRDREVAVAVVVSGAVNAVHGEFMAKKTVTLTSDVAQNLPLLRIDPDRLERVLINLLNNAAKFTETGTVTLRAFLSEQGLLRLVVQDTGVGIPEHELERIFDKFHKVESSNNGPKERPGGTGLGLSICKEIVQHYGGRIWAESRLGEGSALHIELPATLFIAT